MTAIRHVGILLLALSSFGGSYRSTATVHAQEMSEKQGSQSKSDSDSKTQPDQTNTKSAGDTQQDLITRLEKFLTGTKWTGNFTIDGKENLISEHYEICPPGNRSLVTNGI